MPGNAPNEAVQSKYVEHLHQLFKQAQEGEIHLLFFDPTHQVHNTVIGKCWQPIGGENTITLPSNTGRRRLSVLGAINAITMQFSSIITEDNCDQDMVQATLKSIRSEYLDDKKIVMILDNASYNRAYATRDCAVDQNICLEFLPPYCPNLNLIERLWKFMKKKILRCQYYPTFKEFYTAVFDFCRNLPEYSEEIESIFSQKFQIIKEV